MTNIRSRAKDLNCTFCGGTLYVHSAIKGDGMYPESIECSRCPASWLLDGVLDIEGNPDAY